jgi:hypothetical protein
MNESSCRCLAADKISWVIQERESIIQFRSRKSGTQSAPAGGSMTADDAGDDADNRKSALLEIVSPRSRAPLCWSLGCIYKLFLLSLGMGSYP